MKHETCRSRYDTEKNLEKIHFFARIGQKRAAQALQGESLAKRENFGRFGKNAYIIEERIKKHKTHVEELEKS